MGKGTLRSIKIQLKYVCSFQLYIRQNITLDIVTNSPELF